MQKRTCKIKNKHKIYTRTSKETINDSTNVLGSQIQWNGPNLLRLGNEIQ